MLQTSRDPIFFTLVPKHKSYKNLSIKKTKNITIKNEK